MVKTLVQMFKSLLSGGRGGESSFLPMLTLTLGGSGNGLNSCYACGTPGLGSQLLVGPSAQAAAVVGIWAVNQQRGAGSLSFSVSPCLPNKKNKIKKLKPCVLSYNPGDSRSRLWQLFRWRHHTAARLAHVHPCLWAVGNSSEASNNSPIGA